MKKNYWIKLQAKFFNDKRIAKIRRLAGGDTYTIIYLKMILMSLGTDNIIRFENVEKTIEEEIAYEIHENLDNVKATILIAKQLDMIEMNENNDIFCIEAIELTCSESSSAERVRKYRAKLKNENIMLQSNNCNSTRNKIVSTDIEKDLDIEKDSDSKLKKQKKDHISFINFKNFCISNCEKIKFTLPYPFLNLLEDTEVKISDLGYLHNLKINKDFGTDKALKIWEYMYKNKEYILKLIEKEN